MEQYKFSIIIPAYNEEVLIVKTLSSLLEDNTLHTIELVVVCNACQDNTHTRTISFLKENELSLQQKNINFLVFETDKASKTNALNLGVSNSKSSIKVLMDADIEISGKDINTLVTELKDSHLKAISPKIKFSFNKSDFLVRQYYRVASLSFYNINHRLSNVIALSETGIKQITPLPEIIADDEYIRRQFLPSEVAVSQQCALVFTCAKNLSNLLQVLTRVERGNVQLNNLKIKKPAIYAPKGYNKPPWFCMPTFILIKLVVKIRAKLQFMLGKTKQWERDESNRIS
ncbi:glycosyltransferase [Thalassotalea castellviae]|uniref:Glycosyltransferase n=1 Tax=Thalassotalea castellviae TaxID=3075612 RepID=A0ABU2ZY08_9GAMM|nr:glycosyltransferase [Thalassotalea sp. W431]MDT0602794.1 glycosyltransferase [Thalassotalea sp. W431]